jgi:hypothetical protein
MGLILGPCRLGLDLSCSPWRYGGLPWTLGALSFSSEGSPWSLERLALGPYSDAHPKEPWRLEAHPELEEVYLGAMELHPVALEAHSWSM